MAEQKTKEEFREIKIRPPVRINLEDEDYFPEGIILEDKLGFVLKDFAGRYIVITKRYDNRISCFYFTSIYDNETGVDISPYFKKGSTKFTGIAKNNFDSAIETHQSILKDLLALTS